MPNYIPEFQGYSGQGAFRYWCQKVLPLVYDDSLSYYELLNKIVVYLNNTIEDVAKAEGNIDSLLTAYTQLQTFVNDYFDNLDVQEEINNKLDVMAENGDLSALILPFIPNLVTTWLNEHITPTSPPVDDTLSISGAAADAKVTGDELAKAIKTSGLLLTPTNTSNYTSADDFPLNKIMGIESTITELIITNLPEYGVPSYVITSSLSPTSTRRFQLFINRHIIAVRARTGGGVWSEWMRAADEYYTPMYRPFNKNVYNSLAEVPENTIYTFSDVNWSDLPTGVSAGAYYSFRYAPNFKIQIVFCINTDNIAIWWRVVNRNDYSIYVPWQGIAKLSDLLSLSTSVATKANTTDVVTYELYDLSEYTSMAATPLNKIRSFSAENVTWTDIPPNLTSGVFYNMRVSANYKIQVVYEYQGAYHLWFRIVGVESPYTVLVGWHKMIAPEDITTLENDSVKLVVSGSTYKTENNLTTASQINENVIMLGENATFSDLPYGNGVFINLRYSQNYNLQFMIHVSTGKCSFRVTNRNTGAVFTDWTIPTLFEIRNILALGDSICFGARNGRKGFIGYFNLSVTNESRVAARLSNTRINEDTGEYKSYCIYKQLIDFATDTNNSSYVPDIIIADGGVNDYAYVNNSVQLGAFNGIPKTTDAQCENLDLSTIAGGTEYLFYNMIKYYPSAQRFFVLTHRTKNFPYTQNTNGFTQTDAYDLIKNIAKCYGVYVIDVFNESMINTAFSEYISPIPYSSSNPSATEDYYVDDDGIHPLDKGYREGYVPLIREALRIGTKKS